MIYNEGYAAFAGQRHPVSLGSNVREHWPEVAEFNANVLKVVLGGGTLGYRDQHLVIERNGSPEDVWLNLDYSAVPDENGVPAGVLAIIKDTTYRVRTRTAPAHCARGRRHRHVRMVPANRHAWRYRTNIAASGALRPTWW